MTVKLLVPGARVVADKLAPRCGVPVCELSPLATTTTAAAPVLRPVVAELLKQLSTVTCFQLAELACALLARGRASSLASSPQAAAAIYSAEPEHADTDTDASASAFTSATELEHVDTAAASYSATEPELAATATDWALLGENVRRFAASFRQACRTSRCCASRAASNAMGVRCWSPHSGRLCVASFCLSPLSLCDARQPCSDLQGLSMLVAYFSCNLFAATHAVAYSTGIDAPSLHPAST